MLIYQTINFYFIHKPVRPKVIFNFSPNQLFYQAVSPGQAFRSEKAGNARDSEGVL